jgi:hypothetical protein
MTTIKLPKRYATKHIFGALTIAIAVWSIITHQYHPYAYGLATITTGIGGVLAVHERHEKPSSPQVDAWISAYLITTLFLLVGTLVNWILGNAA